MKLHILYNYKTGSGTTDSETASMQSRHQRMKKLQREKEIRSYFGKRVHRKAAIITRQISRRKKSRKDGRRHNNS